jgi:HEAT repeat protein
MTKLRISGFLVVFLIALLLSGCNSTSTSSREASPPTSAPVAPGAEISACLVKRVISDKEMHDPKVATLVQRLKDTNVEKRKAAATSLGKMGPAAGASITPLYLSLQGQNAFEVAFDGSYPATVATAIANIAQADAVPVSYVIFRSSQGEKVAPADVVIWADVLRRVGPSAVPCICQLVENDKDVRVRTAYVRVLDFMASQNALKEGKAQAETTLNKARSDPDANLRKAAEEASGSLAKR